MKTKIYLFIFIMMALTNHSCVNSNHEDEPINSSCILRTNDSIKNIPTITGIRDRINLLINEENERSKGFESSKQKVKLENATMVSLKSEVAKIFDPENCPCSLPSKIMKKLKNMKEDGKPWAPPFVVQYMSKMPDTVLYIPRNGINNILHYVNVKKSRPNTSFSWLVTGVPTYTDLNVEDFILKGYNSFFYSLDCSGYLNAAIEGAAATPGVDIKTSAKSALEKQNSMFVGGGVIVSPLLAAYYGNIVKMDSLTRVKILQALISIPNTSDNDTIDMDLSFDAVWAANNGSSSFNGKVDINAQGGANFGIASVSASANGGASLSRKTSFSLYNTYIAMDHPLKNPSAITISQIKSVLLELTTKKK